MFYPSSIARFIFLAGSTLHAAHCTLHIVHYIWYIYCTLRTLPTPENAPETAPVHFIPHIEHFELHAYIYTACCTFVTSHWNIKYCLNDIQHLQGKMNLNVKIYSIFIPCFSFQEYQLWWNKWLSYLAPPHKICLPFYFMNTK